VTPAIGGKEALGLIRDGLEKAIAHAESIAGTVPPGERGHVYLALWRFSPQRDLSESNRWALGPWRAGDEPRRDQTALGLVLRLMQAGVRVRLLLWCPQVTTDFIVGDAHIEGHVFTARAVEHWDRKLSADRPQPPGGPIGVAALDLRVAETAPPAAHQQAQFHQKLAVIRVGPVVEAHCGGLDLTFTRRDAPAMRGDWQSGADIPDPSERWPGWADFAGLAEIEPPRHGHRGDLPPEIYGERRQIWHGQHLKLEGPIVADVEEEFRRRWTDSGDVALLDQHATARPRWSAGQAVMSSAGAVRDGRIIPLPPARPVPAIGASAVQLWHTVPWRAARSSAPPLGGEYTLMAGLANACARSKELIWIFDQYFWSRPLARMLNRLLHERPGLCVLIVLPPYAGGGSIHQPAARTVHAVHHRARRLALTDLVHGLGEQAAMRVGVYNLWHRGDQRQGDGTRGIYCHAKAHTYDGSLLVCGSGNLSWRSFTRDVETTAAVVDRDVVRRHQRNLWNWLFHDAPWPVDAAERALDLDEGGSGAAFLAAFQNRVREHPSYLIPDRWRLGTFPLPNGTVRTDEINHPEEADDLLRLTDPNALPIADLRSAGAMDEIPLDTVVRLLDSHYGHSGAGALPDAD
jgi:hypothetical protein